METTTEFVNITTTVPKSENGESGTSYAGIIVAVIIVLCIISRGCTGSKRSQNENRTFKCTCIGVLVSKCCNLCGYLTNCCFNNNNERDNTNIATVSPPAVTVQRRRSLSSVTVEPPPAGTVQRPRSVDTAHNDVNPPYIISAPYNISDPPGLAPPPLYDSIVPNPSLPPPSYEEAMK